VGSTFRIKYYSNDQSSPEGQSFETEIVHITKDDKGRFKGHYLVGLSVANWQNEVAEEQRGHVLNIGK